jgi:hypothetical protein
MTRAPSTFRQRDLTAAIKGARAAGIEVMRIEIDKDGKIVIVTDKAFGTEPSNDLDKWMHKHAREIEGH